MIPLGGRCSSVVVDVVVVVATMIVGEDLSRNHERGPGSDSHDRQCQKAPEYPGDKNHDLVAEVAAVSKKDSNRCCIENHYYSRMTTIHEDRSLDRCNYPDHHRFDLVHILVDRRFDSRNLDCSFGRNLAGADCSFDRSCHDHSHFECFDFYSDFDTDLLSASGSSSAGVGNLFDCCVHYHLH